MDALETPLGDALLSCIEDASLNLSAPPQQFWLDGWTVSTVARALPTSAATTDGNHLRCNDGCDGGDGGDHPRGALKR